MTEQIRKKVFFSWSGQPTILGKNEGQEDNFFIYHIYENKGEERKIYQFQEDKFYEVTYDEEGNPRLSKESSEPKGNFKKKIRISGLPMKEFLEKKGDKSEKEKKVKNSAIRLIKFVKKFCKENNYEYLNDRNDIDRNTESADILYDIEAQIRSCDFYICDLTPVTLIKKNGNEHVTYLANENVAYEFGFARGVLDPKRIFPLVRRFDDKVLSGVSEKINFYDPRNHSFNLRSSFFVQVLLTPTGKIRNSQKEIGNQEYLKEKLKNQIESLKPRDEFSYLSAPEVLNLYMKEIEYASYKEIKRKEGIFDFIQEYIKKLQKEKNLKGNDQHASEILKNRFREKTIIIEKEKTKITTKKQKIEKSVKIIENFINEIRSTRHFLNKISFTITLDCLNIIYCEICKIKNYFS